MKFIKAAGFLLMASLAHAGTSEIRRSEAKVGHTSNDKSEALSILDTFVTNNDLSDRNKQIEFNQLVDLLLPTNNIDKTVTPRLATYNEISDSPRETQILPTLFCTGEDTKKKNIAGVCMDGNFLWYTSADCSDKCRCGEAGEVHCDIPNDCGPHKDVVEFCLGNEGFTCSCLIGERDVGSTGRPEVGGAVEAEEKDHGLALAELMTPSSKENANIDGIPDQAQKVDIQGESDQQDQERNTDAGPQNAQEGGIPMINPCFLMTTCAGKTQNHWGDTFLMMPTTMATVTNKVELTS